jgi:DNA-binding SARP family transcriptional activator
MGRPGPAGSGSVGQLELRLAGAFKVVRDSVELTDGQIGSRKSRTLLKLLAVERPGLVPVDRIVEILWPDDQPAAPEQNVAILVSRLRAALGPGLIQGGRSGYRLASGPGIVVDLDLAAGFCGVAEGKLGSAAAVALAAAERAHQLLVAGTAIGDEPYADWADPAREQVRELLRRVRLVAAEAALTTGDPRLAAGYAEAAITADPLDEAAHRWYMSASAAAGEQAKALAGYEALRQRLGRELGADPAPQTRELHLAILREQDGGRDSRPDQRRSAAAGHGDLARGTPLAGRDCEIGLLRQAWDSAAGGQPGLVTIVGEAGIGKTALAEALAAEAAEDGGTVLRTRCYETERSLFLQPVVEAIAPVVARTQAGMLRRLLGEHAAAARRARGGGRWAAARGRGHSRATTARADQHGYGASARLRGAPGHPARPGGAQPGPAPGRRPAVRRAVNDRAHAPPGPRAGRHPAPGAGHRPRGERRPDRHRAGPGGRPDRRGAARA